ncbi:MULTISPECIES: hypothetical protein [Flavobacterium]|uniref:hypothetical protein n=1 Tax=Flavobacterium TaxID=237 RepID=UPI000869276F|nr:MULTISPECIES: hypothetical protein [Flavobacterium]MBN9286052.1 hypothetical protein [Flavobacterium sp.]ODS90252.1 MAG: hypothetical protein ABS44_01015 [Chryseobacterium sp. SCN 40-13]OJV68415.1 MAG: hypothetical protein BGO42_05425 [Flavobacterium sp. 40-81]
MLYIFKTSVKTKKDARKIERVFTENEAISHFNFDLEDCDKILRVSSEKLEVTDVTNLITALGYHCEELSA